MQAGALNRLHRGPQGLPGRRETGGLGSQSGERPGIGWKGLGIYVVSERPPEVQGLGLVPTTLVI